MSRSLCLCISILLRTPSLLHSAVTHSARSWSRELLGCKLRLVGSNCKQRRGVGDGFGTAGRHFPLLCCCCSSLCAVLQQVEGPLSPEELVEILQRTMDEQGSAFRGLREAKEEARRASHQLRQEQDTAFLEALKKDKEKEREPRSSYKRMSGKQQHKKRLRRHPMAKPPINKQKEASKEKQPTTKILIRFPDGTRKEQSFLITETIRSIYKYVDSQDVPGIGSYQLVSFPKRIYGHEQLDMTLRDAGLYPNAALFLEQL